MIDCDLRDLIQRMSRENHFGEYPGSMVSF